MLSCCINRSTATKHRHFRQLSWQAAAVKLSRAICTVATDYTYCYSRPLLACSVLLSCSKQHQSCNLTANCEASATPPSQLLLHPAQLTAQLTDNSLAISQEPVLRHLQVVGCRALPDASTYVIMTTMAWTEPSIVVTGTSNGNTAQVGTHTHDHQVLQGGRQQQYVAVRHKSSKLDMHDYGCATVVTSN